MRLIILNGTKRRRDMGRTIFQYLGDMFDLPKDFRVTLHFVHCSNSAGTCMSSGPKAFRIEISDRSDVETTIRLLVHEFTHLMQTLVNKCITDAAGVTYYNGKRYSKKYINPECIEYWYAPWEIDARGMENTIIDLISYRLNICPAYLTWHNCGSLITALKGNRVRK